MNNLVLCMKWGDRYGPEYVNRLHAMARRNLRKAFDFVCFTDNTNGLHSSITALPLPPLGCPHPTNVPGKWPKVALWNHDLFGLQGTALFVDLDTVIVDSIDSFFDYGDPHDVVLAKNWLKPLKKLGQTTLFRFPIGGHPYMLEDFQKSPQQIAERYRFEQHYVTNHIRGGVKFWPSKWVRHYRYHCLGNNYLMRYLRPARLSKGTSIVAFPGMPNPLDATLGQWCTTTGPRSRSQHLKDTLHREKYVKPSLLAHLKCFHLPCPWVIEHWRE